MEGKEEEGEEEEEEEKESELPPILKYNTNIFLVE